MKPADLKECRQCKVLFRPWSSTQTVCGRLCAGRLVKEQKKAEAVQTRERKAALKPRQKWLAECQAIVNKIVRLRDADKPCCSCDRPASWDGQWHASHYRSVGAASAVRFNLWNIHKGCSICNNHLSGNIAAYTPRLIERIGTEKHEWLMNQNQLVRHDIPYLEKFKRVMGKRLKRMEKQTA